MMFRELVGDTAVICSGGVYKQAPLFTRTGYLYAAAFGGFVRIFADGSTSREKCFVDALSIEGQLFRDAFGRLCDGSVAGALPLAGDAARRLTRE